MDLPTVSVVLPNYNHAEYVGQALRALLDQSVRPVEIVVVDDGSTDDSVDVVRSFRSRTSELRLLCNEKNHGVVYSMNRGARTVRGDFVYFASADDLVLPGFFEHSLTLLAHHPQARICFTDQNFIQDHTGTLTPKHVAIARRPSYLSPSELVARLRSITDSIGSSGTLIHRETLREVGYFSEDLRWHADWFLTLVIAFRYGACYVPEPLTAFRLKEGSYSDGMHRRAEQDEVLHHLLRELGSSAFVDVASHFHEARVLGDFGLQIVRVAVRRHHLLLAKLPYGRVLWRELKNLLILVGPPSARRAFWILRHRWQMARGRS